MSDLGDDVGSWFNDLGSKLDDKFGNLKTWFGDLGIKLDDKFSNLKTWFGNLGDDIGNWFNDLGDKLDNKFTDLKTWFGNLGDDLHTWFDDLWTNIDEGLRSISSSFVDKFTEMTDWLNTNKEEEKTEENKQENQGSELINDNVSIVKNKFNFVDNVKKNVDDMASAITDETNTPKFSITIKSKYYSGSINVIDLSWYAPYKEYGDSIICMYCYLSFLWNIFKRLPDIIQGAGAGSYSVYMAGDIQAYKNTGFGRSSSIQKGVKK